MAKKSTQPARKRVTFSCNAEAGSDVYVAGTFNNWSPTQKRLERKEDGTYKCTCLVPKGTHEYKFVINGEWRTDEKNPETRINEVGSANSVIHV